MTVLRTTQQVAQVAEQNDAKLRMTMQYVQVLYTEESGPAPQSIEDTGLQSMSDAATVETVLNLTASNAISVSDDVANFVNDRCGNTLAIVDIAVAEIVINHSLSDTLVLTDPVSVVRNQSYLTSSAISLADSATAIRLFETQVVEDTLSLSDTAVQSRPVASDLTLTQLAEATIGGISDSASDAIGISDTATVALVTSRSLTDTLALTQEAIRGFSGVLSVDQELGLTDHAVATTTEDYILLFAPFPAVAASIVLPRPMLGDKEGHACQMKLRRSMNGVVYTNVKTTNRRIFSYTFDMTVQKGYELQAFFEEYVAEHMKLQNWKGEIWDVQLLTNPIEYVNNRRNGPVGQVGVNLQFEGIKLSG